MLYRTLRVEKGLAYMFQAWDRGYTEAGAWRVLVGAESANCPAVVATVRDNLERVAVAGPDEDDLAAALRQARMRLILDMESPQEHTRLLGYRWCAGHTTPLAREVAALDGVSGEDVRRAAEELVRDLIVVAAPEPSGP